MTPLAIVIVCLIGIAIGIPFAIRSTFLSGSRLAHRLALTLLVAGMFLTVMIFLPHPSWVWLVGGEAEANAAGMGLLAIPMIIGLPALLCGALAFVAARYFEKRGLKYRVRTEVEY